MEQIESAELSATPNRDVIYSEIKNCRIVTRQYAFTSGVTSLTYNVNANADFRKLKIIGILYQQKTMRLLLYQLIQKMKFQSIMAAALQARRSTLKVQKSAVVKNCTVPMRYGPNPAFIDYKRVLGHVKAQSIRTRTRRNMSKFQLRVRYSSRRDATHIISGASYEQKNNAQSKTSIIGLNRSNIQLFVHFEETGKTLVQPATHDITLKQFIKAALAKARLQQKPQTELIFSLNGRDLKPIESKKLCSQGVQNFDTLTIKSGQLLGGSRVPLPGLKKVKKKFTYDDDYSTPRQEDFQLRYISPRYNGDQVDDPGQDLKRWRQLSASQLAKLAFQNTESGESQVNMVLLNNCEQDQIDELLGLLKPEQKKMVETAQLKLFLCKTEKEDKMVEAGKWEELDEIMAIPFDEIKERSLDAYSSRTYSPDGLQLYVLNQMTIELPLYTLQENQNVWVELKPRNYQLRVYNSSKPAGNNLLKCIDLHLSGKVRLGLQCIMNPFSKDVAFLTVGKERKTLKLHVQLDSQTKINTTLIPETSNFSKTFLGCLDNFSQENQQYQFVNDKQGKLMIVYIKQIHNCAVAAQLDQQYKDYDTLFHDVETGRDILRIVSEINLLYIEISLGNDKDELHFKTHDFLCSYLVDFAAARGHTQDIFDSGNTQQVQKILHAQASDKIFQTDIQIVEVVQWSKNDKHGFAFCCYFPAISTEQKHIIVYSKSRVSRFKVETNERIILSRDKQWKEQLQQWQSCGQEFDEKQYIFNTQLETCHHLMLIYESLQSSILVKNLQTKDQLLLSFEDTIMSVEVGTGLKPSMTILLENRFFNAKQRMHFVTVSFENHSLKLHPQVDRKEISFDWQKKLCQITAVEPIVYFKANSDLEQIWVRTKTKLLSFTHNEKCSIQSYYHEKNKYLIKDFNHMQFGKHIYIVHEILLRRDIVVAIDHGNKLRVLYTFYPAHVMQCYLFDNALFILDSNQYLLKIELTIDEDGWPKLINSKRRSLQQIEFLKPVIQDYPVRGKILMTDTTIIVNFLIMSIDQKKENSHFCWNEKVIDSKNAEITLLNNMVICKSIIQDDHCTMVAMKSNPGSRRLTLGDKHFMASICKFHQVSLDLLLLQRKWQDQQDWVLMSTNGTMHSISSELAQVLYESYDVQSFHTFSDRCQLLISYKEPVSQKAIKRAQIVELTDDGHVAAKKTLELNQVGDDSVIADEFIMRNYRGDLLQVRAMFMSEDDPTTEQPRFTDGKIKLLTFERMQQNTQSAYAGKFFCWTGDLRVNILDLQTQAKKEIFFPSFIDFAGEWHPSNFQIDASQLRSLIEAGWLTKVKIEKSNIEELADHLQVTIGCHAMMFNLRPDKPVAVNEMNDMDELLEPEYFMETGFKLTKCSKEAVNGIYKRSLYTSPLQNLVIEARNGRENFIYRRFSSNDIFDMQQFADSFDSSKMKSDNKISTYEIQTNSLWMRFFSSMLVKMMHSDKTTLKAIHDSIFAQDFNLDNTDVEQNQRNSALLRRINIWLKKKSVKYDQEKKQLFNESLLTLFADPQLRDFLLKIGQLSPDFCVINTFDDQERFISISKNVTSQVIDSLGDSFVSTGQMSSITMMDWPDDVPELIYSSATIEVSLDELQRLVKLKSKDGSVVKTEVIVELLDLRWFFDGRKNFIAFATILTAMPTSFYSSKFTAVLLSRFWNETQLTIIKKQFVPYIIFLAFTMFYFHTALSPEQAEERESSDSLSAIAIIVKLVGLGAVLLVCYSVWIEYKQFITQEKKLEYIKDLWNLIDISGLALTLFVIIMSICEIEWVSFEGLRVIASMASCLNLLKIFDWLRLFEGTSFYILLIENTIKDIGYFLIILFTALLTFGIPLSMLDLNRDKNFLIDPVFAFWPLAMVYNQYLLALGEFASLDKLTGDNSYEQLVLIFFIGATFYTQLTMLNMLIAIMGDSFDFATENREKFAVKTKMAILSAQAPSLSQTENEDEEKVFLIVVRRSNEDEAIEDEWEGTINKVAYLTKKAIHALEEEIKSDILKQQADIVITIKASENEVMNMQSAVGDIRFSVTDVEEIKARVSRIQDKMIQGRASIEDELKEMTEMMEKLIAAQPIVEGEVNADCTNDVAASCFLPARPWRPVVKIEQPEVKSFLLARPWRPSQVNLQQKSVVQKNQPGENNQVKPKAKRDRGYKKPVFDNKKIVGISSIGHGKNRKPSNWEKLSIQKKEEEKKQE